MMLCRYLIFFWSALSALRLARLVALLDWFQCHAGRDGSRPTKALTGQRTPKRESATAL